MRWVPVALLVALIAVPAVPAAPDDPPKKPTIDELVADLGHPVFGVREKAQRELWERGEEAIPALEKAARSDDEEVSTRARALLDKFAWGVRPDTPPEVLKLIQKFRAGDPNPDRADEVRKDVLSTLLKLGKPGIAAARAILQRNIPADTRDRLTAHVTAVLRRTVPLLLVAGKTDQAADLIELHAAGTTLAGAADYAAFHVLRGDLPAAIARAEALLKTGRRPDDVRLVLVHLYRAAGQWAKARAAAALLPVRPVPEEPTEAPAHYKEMLLEDEGDWAAIADLTPDRPFNHPDAVRLTLLRLAGRNAEFDKLAKSIRDDADELSEPEFVMNAAVALLANQKATDATDLLAQHKTNLALLTEILIARMKYKEALDLIGGGKKEKELIPEEERLEFDLRRARVLMLIGDRDGAVQLFESVARKVKNRSGGNLPGGANTDQVPFDLSARSLIRAELRVGLRDLACEHAALFVMPGREAADDGPSGESPFELLFPDTPVAAEVLFLVLRAAKVPGKEPGPTMIRTRDLLAGTAPKAAVDQAVKLLRESAGSVMAPPGSSTSLMKARRYLAVALVLRAAKRNDDAEAAFKLAAEASAAAAETPDAGEMFGARSWVYGVPDPARVWIEWGDFYTDSGRHRDAAAAYEAGWKLFPDQAMPLFLSGKALIRAGDTKEGERRVELAHWVSLGSEKLRGQFVDELMRRGEGKAVRREIQLILRACWSHDHYFGNVMNQCARGAALIQDFATAAACGQRSLLVVLRTEGVYYVDPGAYMNVPHELLVYRARALLNAGKVAEAMDAARAALAVTPGHLDLVTGMVPDLDRLGHKKEADELFNRAWDAYQKVLSDYPDSAAARHSLALLTAHGRRKLDDGLKYAQAAVKADPGSPAYRAALAEVHFRRGERDDAVKLMQKLAAEYPRNSLYKRQLARYRDGGFDSPWPHTGD